MTYTFYHDPGHGWLKVKERELIDLGIAGNISRYSYQNGADVYLEEDCDLGVFLVAYENKTGSRPEIIEVYQERTPIRGYGSYNPRS